MRRVAVLALVLSACATTPASGPTSEVTSTSISTTWDTSSPFVGFSLSPASYDETGFNEFFERVDEGADLVAWVGAWQEIDRGGTLVYELASQHRYVPVVVTGFPTDADGFREIPDEAGEMIATVTGWLADHPVPFFGFGVEVNSFLHDKAPDDFEWFVTVFPEVAAAVHEASPNTVVFPVFQLEHLRGLEDGLFGGERTAPEWELIDRFPEADAIGFTTYPGLIHRTPPSVPEGYYEEILDHTDKPVVFTEVGWQAGGELGEWTGTPKNQEDFVVDRLPELARMSEMVIWSFLYDQEAGGPAFQTMGLVDQEGNERPAWGAWVEVFG